MKNRTVIGIVCIVLAFLLFFVALPWAVGKAGAAVPAVRAAVRIPRGTKIDESMLETYSAAASALGAGVLTDSSLITSRYAVCDIYPGDSFTEEKLSATSDGTSDALYRLKDGEFAVTVAVSSFSDGFSGQLENGDLVRVFVTDGMGRVSEPAALSYVRVITTVTGKGASRDTAKAGDPNGYEIPSSIMFAVNREQAAQLFGASSGGEIHCAFVCHGSDSRAAAYLAAQEAYFVRKNGEEAASGAAVTAAEPAAGPAGTAAAEAAPWP